MTIQVGDRIPSATLLKATAEGPEPVDTASYFAGRKVDRRYPVQNGKNREHSLDRDQRPLVGRDVGGHRAAAADPHHPIADRETAGAGAEPGDHAGELEPRDLGRRAGRRGIETASLQAVGPVEAGRRHLDGVRGEHVALAPSAERRYVR